MSPRLELLTALVLLKKRLGRRHPSVRELQEDLASLRIIFIISRAMRRSSERKEQKR